MRPAPPSYAYSLAQHCAAMCVWQSVMGGNGQQSAAKGRSSPVCRGQGDRFASD